MFKFLSAAAVAACATTGVAAQEIGYEPDSLAFSAMMDRNWTTAERQLLESASELSNDPAHLLNLAQVYAATGRDAQSQTIYRRVLEVDDMMLVTSDGRPVSAHVLAQSRLSAEMHASR